ncbi:MAG: DNA mismatch repair endonuclease MutL [Candidatus Heimdallarchaeota archaeon]|nr:DNA mismatch repair endonuclease MutL [Candidatus Heimdallarchaeota archaeon]MCG3255036.1 DNA mismatch repair endonuclease MutL [Candidatus Heimdallarchaeota archaeon]MCK4610110.1 DNA mismatch repair endonuclease MutL [Candidatus Heimdallarchaeota archaeon]
MSKKIVKLDKLTISKIAAGEVIERPASVVKELVENSIDAQSSKITINIQEGGKKTVEVIDDGIGMESTDARLSINRHTTSKINNADDLFSIHSLGFRGEALASIVSVAQVEIITKTEESDLGIHLVIEGGEIVSDKQASAPKGTRISVKNLFFNVPVRRKFLKTTSTEINHITEYVTKLALVDPSISFTLTHNGKDILTAPKGDLIAQITAIFGENIARACLPINKKENDYTVTGFITKPEFSRKSKDYLYIFVNGRSVTNKVISDAVLRGYGTAVPHNRYPIIFLYFDLPLDEVDVNVHPSKKEIRFSNEAKVYALIESAIRESLEKSGLKLFETVIETRHKPTTLTSIEIKSHESSKRKLPVSVSPRERPDYTIVKSKEQRIDKFLPITDKNIELQEKSFERKKSIRVLGIIKDTYIVAETQEGLFLCDQHAAHEKINYEKYIRQIKKKSVSIQQLLAPVSVTLKPSEFEIIESIKENLKTFGFEIEVFGKNEILIRSIPSIMGITIEFDTAKDMIDIFKTNVLEIKEKLDLEDLGFVKKIISIFACRRSIKAGDKITLDRAELLLKELLELEEPFTCPHGRPTIIILNEKYIEELFMRDYR